MQLNGYHQKNLANTKWIPVAPEDSLRSYESETIGLWKKIKNNKQKKINTKLLPVIHSLTNGPERIHGSLERELSVA